jgi:hypothetical protein
VKGIKPHHDGNRTRGEEIKVGGSRPSVGTSVGYWWRGSLDFWDKPPGIERLYLVLGFVYTLPPSQTNAG